MEDEWTSGKQNPLMTSACDYFWTLSFSLFIWNEGYVLQIKVKSQGSSFALFGRTRRLLDERQPILYLQL